MLMAACGGGGSDTTAVSDAVVITVQPADQSVVSGSDARFAVSADHADNYRWQVLSEGEWRDVVGGTGTQLVLGQVTRGADGTQYRVLVSGPKGAVLSSAATLRVTPVTVAPALLVPPESRRVTEGQDAAFSVTAQGTGLTFTWEVNRNGAAWSVAGTGSATLLLPARGTEHDGNRYRVIVSNDAGSVTSPEAILWVDAAPKAPAILVPPSDTAVTDRDLFVFGVSVSGVPAPEVYWQWSTDQSVWSEIPAGTGATYTGGAGSVPAGSTRWYRAWAVNANGRVASAAARLTVAHYTEVPVVDGPDIVTPVVMAGDSFRTSVVATGVPAPTLQWQLSTDGGVRWMNIQGATSPEFFVSEVPAEWNGNMVRSVASNVAGTRYSKSIRLDVRLQVPVFTQSPADVHVVAPAPASFHVHATGKPAPTYQWERSDDDGKTWDAIVGSTQATFSIAATDAVRDAGLRFRVAASNAAGSVVSRPVSVNPRDGGGCNIPSGERWCTVTPTPMAWSLLGVAAPTNSQHVAVGVDGIVVRTGDGGLNWAPVSSGTSANLNAVAFSDERVGVAVGDGGVILRSTDTGRSWQTTTSGVTSALARVDFRGRHGVAVGAGGTVLRTSDAGATWVASTSGTSLDLWSVRYASGTVVAAVGSEGAILRSDDAGTTWTRVPSRFTDRLTSIAFHANGTGALSSESGVQRTTDFGQSWAIAGQQRYVGPLVYLPSGRILGAGGSPWPLTSGNDGASWGQDPQPWSTDMRYTDVVVRPDGRAIAVGLGGAVALLDGRWFVPAGPRLIKGDVTDLALAGDLTVFGATTAGEMMRSVDGGATWQGAPQPLDGTGTPAAVSRVAFRNANVGLASAVDTRGRHLHRTGDGGGSWQEVIPLGEQKLNALAWAPDGSVALGVGTLRSIWRSSNGGLSFSHDRQSVIEPYPVELNAVAFADSQVVVAVGSGTGMTHAGVILRSTDAGRTWVPNAEPTPYPLNDVAFGTPAVGLAVGQAGTMLRTTDAGATWTRLPPVNANELFGAVAFVSPTVAYAVGDGSVLRSTDAGLTWTRVTTGVSGLRTVAGRDASRVLMAGDRGVVLQYRPGDR